MCYEQMDWFKKMPPQEQAAYRAKKQRSHTEAETAERELADRDWWEWERQRPAAWRVIDPGLPPHPLYGKNAEEKAFSLLRWIL